jgi:hypothetical protein
MRTAWPEPDTPLKVIPSTSSTRPSSLKAMGVSFPHEVSGYHVCVEERAERRALADP